MHKERILQPIMNAILVFECAARVGSFTAAARVLGTSQPSVSRHISNLESHLGCELFSRHNKKVGLTDAGQALFQVAREGTDALHAVILEFRASSATKVLTIGCTHGFSHLWIMPRFLSLKSLSNEWEMRVVTSEYNNAFESREVDFSIHFCDGHSPPPGIHLFDEEVVLVASPDALIPDGMLEAAKDLEWLSGLPLVHLDEGKEGWVSWREWFASHGVPYKPPPDAYLFRNYAFSLQAAAEGKGVALAWRHLLGPYQTNGWLKVLNFPPLKTLGNYRLVCSEDQRKQDIGARIIEWFKAETDTSISSF